MMNINKRYQAERDLSARLPADVMRHSQLAMRAARRMRASSKKDRHGKLVCQHLLRMLACDTSHAGASHAGASMMGMPADVLVGQLSMPLSTSLSIPLSKSMKGHQTVQGSSEIDARQYSLGF
jgi:hypothetical protein